MIRRARLFFLVALLLAAGILVANFPLGTLLQGRSTAQGEASRLAALRLENRTLASEVRALDDPATVGEIAHEEYGLVTPGQRSIVVLPAAAGAGSAARDPLANNPVPSSDLLPSDAILDPGTPVAPPPSHGPGFWHRVLGDLEFWHSLF
jgi:cell division protein FtsB